MKKTLLFLVMILATSVMISAQTKSSHKVSEVRAHLVYEENGALSRNIFEGNFALWNAVIGEGDAEGHSSSTLIFVVVETDGKEIKTNPILQFSAVSEDGKRVKYQKNLTYYFPTEGASKTFVPVLLHDTGCQKINLTAKLVEKNAPAKIYQTVKKEIPFACGE